MPQRMEPFHLLILWAPHHKPERYRRTFLFSHRVVRAHRSSIKDDSLLASLCNAYFETDTSFAALHCLTRASFLLATAAGKTPQKDATLAGRTP